MNDRFVGMTYWDCCFGETPGTARYALTSSTSGLDWTPLAMRGPDMPRLTALEDDTVCIAFDLVDLFSGPDCESTERGRRSPARQCSSASR